MMTWTKNVESCETPEKVETDETPEVKHMEENQIQQMFLNMIFFWDNSTNIRR